MKFFFPSIFSFFFLVTFNIFSQSGTIADNTGSGKDFAAGSGSWPYVFNAAIKTDDYAKDGRSTQNAQTLKINITSLPEGGANYRLYRTNANGNGFSGNSTALSLGLNTITAAATAFDRTCKFQFSSGAIEYDAIYYNNDVGTDDDGTTIADGDINTTASPSIFETTSNGSWPRLISAALISHGSSSQLQQVIKLNVTKLDGDGANYRVYKTTSNGGDFFGNATGLKLGLNTITVSAVAFDRAVKIQFSQDSNIEFREVSVNNSTSDNVDSSVLFADTGNASWPRVLTAVTESERATSQGQQSLDIFITKLPGGGANYRKYITYRNGSNAFTGITKLTLGPNTITQASVDFNRTLKWQFSNNEIEFSSVTLNDAVFWDGSTDTDWDTAANWSTSTVPTSATSVLIRGGASNYPIASGNITVDANESIRISKGASLKINGNLTNNGTVFLDSDSNEFASIIVGGTSSGNITYSRYVSQAATDEWDLIGSPVDGLSISSFATTNTAVTGTNTVSGTNTTATLATNGDQYAVGEYDNSNNTWTNYTTGTVGGAGNFDIGKGYQMGSVSSTLSRLYFTGTIATTDQTQAIIDNDAANGGAGKRWSLIANPFPSYLNANTNAHATNNFLTVNASKLHDSYEAVYGYDSDGTGYTVYNQSTAATYIAPGQGFFVASASTSSDDVSFTEAMQTTTGTDDFAVGDIMQDYELILKLNEIDTEIDRTRFYFKDGLNTHLDPGYDAGHFDQQAAFMSRLLEDDEGVGLVINAMSIENIDDAIIPIVINRAAGSEFRISIDTFDIFPGINVYFEDNQNGTMTLLNDEDFLLTPEDNLTGAGRFFVHLTYDTLSSNEPTETSMLNAYKEIDASYITIEGLATQTNETNVSLYNILGRKVLSTTLNNNMGTQTISTVGLSAGIYVIELESGSDRLTKKLLIQ